jgi:hypothetical protein
MKKNKLVGRNLTTEESRKFWEAVKSDAGEVRLEPTWKRAGISPFRTIEDQNSQKAEDTKDQE